ncbi:MAG: GGDEF domain-containing phosphodiesterase [Zoogloeaceae bacterium]|nr:GGDEF domain-containing phosphodiesterase [Zoogloeaceae bacterium]
MPEFADHDAQTGLRGSRQAMADLAALLAQDAHGTGEVAHHGVVTIALRQDAGLLRLSPEHTNTLRQHVTLRLASALRPQDQIYALTEREWLVLLPTLPSPASVQLAMLRMQRALHVEAPQFPGDPFEFLATCGGAFAPDHGDDPDHLLQSARIALWYADRMREPTALYHPGMEQDNVRRSRLLQHLQEALHKNELQLFLQPQLTLTDLSCRHAEALLRWSPPGESNEIEPQQIITLLEEIGQRARFNRWLFQRTAQYFAQLTDSGYPDVRLAVNLTARDLLDLELPDLVGQSLALWRVPPERLTLEITETAAVQETRETCIVMQRLRTLGCRLSIDDFGSGYANMAWLQRMPVQEIKIDKRFIQSTRPRDQKITRAIADLAHTLGVDVIAEGVETPETLEFVRSIGCTRLQGFLYGQAMDLERFRAFLQQEQPT